MKPTKTFMDWAEEEKKIKQELKKGERFARIEIDDVTKRAISSGCDAYRATVERKLSR